MKKFWTSITIAVIFLILILDSKTAILGASAGITACLHSVIPSLFPFFVLSILLTDMLFGQNIPIFSDLGKLCKIPKGAESILAIGLLGGYPVGAQAISRAYDDGKLSKEDAERMLGFCNNAGPAFIFGMIGAQFPFWYLPWALWFIHILSAMIVGAILPHKDTKGIVLSNRNKITATDAVKKAVNACALVCSWVVLFRIGMEFLDKWFLNTVSSEVKTGIFGLLELANGCLNLGKIENFGIRFVFCSAMLGFGGLCVALQTAAVTQKCGIGMYFPGKLLQCLISVFLAMLTQNILLPMEMRMHIPIWIYVGILLLCSFMCRILWKKKNSSRNFKTVGV